MYNAFMDIEFDPAKDAANIIKHGVSLVEADSFGWAAALVRADNRSAYGEDRMTAIGYIGARLHVVVFADRGDVRRVISLRKASKREERIYAEA